MWVNYEKIDHLGQGAFGRVKKVKRAKDGEVCLKSYLKLAEILTELKDSSMQDYRSEKD